jgi:hypothetical protein
MEANGGEWRISAMLDTCMEITVGDRDGDGIPLRRGWRVLKQLFMPWRGVNRQGVLQCDGVGVNAPFVRV